VAKTRTGHINTRRITRTEWAHNQREQENKKRQRKRRNHIQTAIMHSITHIDGYDTDTEQYHITVRTNAQTVKSWSQTKDTDLCTTQQIYTGTDIWQCHRIDKQRDEIHCTDLISQTHTNRTMSAFKQQLDRWGQQQDRTQHTVKEAAMATPTGQLTEAVQDFWNGE